MKFTKIRFVGPTNVDFPVEDVTPEGPYILKGADGVGPSEIAVSIAPTLLEGGVYQGRRPANKEPVFRVGLQPDWDVGQTAGELRAELYGLLTPRFGKPIILRFMNESVVVAQTEGQVSKMEIAAFAKDPEVQITFPTFKPYFYAPTSINSTPTKTVNGSLTNFDVDNIGDAPSGFWMGITFTAAVAAGTGVVLTDDAADGESMAIMRSFGIGDTLIIDTRAGSRGVWRIPSGGGAKTSILNDLDEDSPWMQLHGGVNTLHINNIDFDWYTDTAPNPDVGPFAYLPAYWGV